MQINLHSAFDDFIFTINPKVGSIPFFLVLENFPRAPMAIAKK
jgi:hypothetical protein